MDFLTAAQGENMKTVIYGLLALVLIPCMLLAIMSCTARTVKTGLAANKLPPCPESPNCVVSENETAVSRIEPLLFAGPPEQAWAVLRQVVVQNGGTIRQDQNNYLWTTFTSRIFRFVDDVEFRLDAGHGMIHVRSASRVGHSDLGVNRKRVEKLRLAFKEVLK
jgi:uncharacterized protein (DUF1499 family)